MAGFKNGKIMLPIKEFLIVKGQATYELNTIDMTKVTVFYRKYNQEAFLETYSEMPKGDYRINEVGGNKQLEITNLDILDEYYSIQLARVVDLTSSPYSPSGQIDVITLNQHLNEVIADVAFLFTYLKDVGVVMDSASGNKILAELKPYTTWYMDKDGNMAAMPVDSLFEKFNNLVKELRKEVLKLLEQDLEVAERELLEEVKRQLDEYVETDLKQRLDDYTTQLEGRLQTMIDQAVADKGLMPEGSDWLEIGLGNWLVVDLFNKNYIHYPPQLNSSDNAGVVKKDITDGGKSQVIRFYTTTGKMLFIVRVNEVWSEWQELGGQTDTMQFTQPNHEFVFTAVTLDGATRQWVKANKYTSADGIAIKIDNDRFDVVTRGVVNIPTSARDDKGEPFVYDEYYFLSQEVDGGFSRTKNEIGTFQYLAHISEIDNKQVAYIDIGDSYDLDYEVVDTETADRVGIGTYKTTLRTADTIEDLKRLNLKEGDVVEVLGYYTKGDGANHKRKIENSDDGSGIQLSNGLYANITHNGEVNVSWFGTKSNAILEEYTWKNYDGFDNSELIVKCYEFCLNNKCIMNIYQCGDMAILKPIVFIGQGITINCDKNSRIIKTNNIETSLGDKTFNGGTLNFDIDVPLLWIPNEELTSYVYEININGLNIHGINTQEMAIYIPKMARYTINNVTCQWVKRGIAFNDGWLGRIYGLTGNQLQGALIKTYVPTGSSSGCGTSNIIERCWVNTINGNTKDRGAYELYGLGYSTVISCASDHVYNLPHVYFTQLSNITFINCGSEDIKVFAPIGNDEGSVRYIGGSHKPINTVDDGKSEYTYLRVYSGDVDIKKVSFGTMNIDSSRLYKVYLQGYGVTRVDNCDGMIGKYVIGGTQQYMEIVGNDIYYGDITNNFGKLNKYLKDKNTSTIDGIRIKTNDNRGVDIDNQKGITGAWISPLNHNFQVVHQLNAPNENYNLQFKYNSGGQGDLSYRLRGDYGWGEWKTIQEKTVATTLNTPYYVNKMKQEGGTTLDDFYSYMDNKIIYDKQLEAEQQAKYEAYQLALQSNPNLTYEEFIASLIPVIEEPTIPQSVQEFMKKYL